MFEFKELKKSSKSKARLGVIKTNSNTFYTPIFMPVGTKGTIKGIDTLEAMKYSSGIILANTYHLMLEPGIDVINKFNGIKNMMEYHNSMLTDSGGFQVFSLAKPKDISDKGVYFKNFKNGDKLFLSPEKSIELQYKIGADIMMAFDECVKLPAERKYLEKSIERTFNWAKRSIETHKKLKSNQAIFGIFQGGLDKELRLKSLKQITSLNFDGIAIGGLSVGETNEEMYDMLDFLKDKMPSNKPRYLMGVGTPQDFLTAVKYGVDMMDCVLPTRNARHGKIFTTLGVVNIKNEKYKFDDSILDPNLDNYFSKYKKAYIRHLFKADEMLGFKIATIQNLAYMQYLTQKCQEALKDDKFEEFYESIIKIYPIKNSK